MLRRLIILAVLTAALAPAASAQAGHHRASFKAPGVKLAECRSGDATDVRSATFMGRMRALKGTDRMAMRFTLLERFGDEKLHPVDFPELRAWHFSKPGIRDFRFKQTVTGLQGGGEYRMRVEYRWLDAAGNLQRKTQRTSAACREPGALANLLPGLATAAAGPEGTSVYVVPVSNNGKVEAQDIGVELYVDGAATNVGHIDSLAPGESRDVRFTGPVCKRNLRVVVDPADTVKERSEADNVALTPCPVVAR
jgi:hypothetical protein